MDSVEAEFFAGALIAPPEWPVLATALAQGAKTDCEQAERFATLAARLGSDRIETYIDIFCTDQRTPRKSIVTKAIKDPGLIERLNAEQERVCQVLERRNAVACRDRSAALLTVAEAVLTRYRAKRSGAACSTMTTSSTRPWLCSTALKRPGSTTSSISGSTMC